MDARVSHKGLPGVHMHRVQDQEKLFNGQDYPGMTWGILREPTITALVE